VSVLDLPAPTARTGEPVARVRDLHVSLARGGVRSAVLRGIDLDVLPGEVLAMVGESGSGKSVLGLTLMGLLPEASAPQVTGEVVVAGTAMAPGAGTEAARRQVRRVHLGAVFQDPMTSLNPTMRVGAQIAEAAGSDDEVQRLLRAVGVPSPEQRARAYPHELSGGLRQRVMIAMAVAGRPSLVIADEPTTALDVTVQAQVLDLLRSLRDELGCSVLMVTHDLGVAGQVADRIAVMYAGRLAEVGRAANVLRSPAHPYTAGLLASRLSLSTDRTRALRTLPPERSDPALRQVGCPYRARCALAHDRCASEAPPMEPPPLQLGQVPAPGHVRACWAPDVAAHRAAELTEASGAALRGAPPVVPAPHGDAGSVPEPAPEVPPVVSISRLTCSFPVRVRGRRTHLQALRGVDLQVAPAEAVAVVGESGSGKSTLLRVVAGLQRASGGEVTTSGATRPQMVFQDAGASLTPWMSVGALLGERLATEGVPQRERAARIARALEQVELPAAVQGARAAELSGGQRQRVALARATIVPPPVLLCDEPTSALDASLAATVLNLVTGLRERLGMAVLFVTHDLSVARLVGDRIAVMYLGRLVEVGPAEQVMAAPVHPYTRALLAAVPELGSALPEVRGEPASPLAVPPGCAFHPRCPAAAQRCTEAALDVRLERHRPGEPALVACIRHRELAP